MWAVRRTQPTGELMPPIYMTSTYIQDAQGVNKGYDYTRADNPNFTILETCLAGLEEAKYATIFSSGLRAYRSDQYAIEWR